MPRKLPHINQLQPASVPIVYFFRYRFTTFSPKTAPESRSYRAGLEPSLAGRGTGALAESLGAYGHPTARNAPEGLSAPTNGVLGRVAAETFQPGNGLGSKSPRVRHVTCWSNVAHTSRIHTRPSFFRMARQG